MTNKIYKVTPDKGELTTQPKKGEYEVNAKGEPKRVRVTYNLARSQQKAIAKEAGKRGYFQTTGPGAIAALPNASAFIAAIGDAIHKGKSLDKVKCSLFKHGDNVYTRMMHCSKCEGDTHHEIQEVGNTMVMASQPTCFKCGRIRPFEIAVTVIYYKANNNDHKLVLNVDPWKETSITLEAILISLLKHPRDAEFIRAEYHCEDYRFEYGKAAKKETDFEQ
ncbi:MAG: hypothetical protein GY928_33855 [Colwellia sp.]|nr:hypothetical protein [Colwellia sp.]